MKKENINKILSDLETGYDLVADKFSDTRKFMWRDLDFLKAMMEPGDRVLDFGCGNGRLAGFLNNKYKEFVGIDISQNLIDIASQKYSNEKTKFIKLSSVSDHLPYEDNYFDVIVSIAVFHHFPNEEYALQIAKELHRLLKPGGTMIITVWNLWQNRFWKYQWKAAKDKVIGKSELNWKDFFLPFRSGDKLFMRFHHAFGGKELKKIFCNAGFKAVTVRSSGKNKIVEMKK
jgi:ubiquinone/menaquinone biosynthesis C-methylase UbiE